MHKRPAKSLFASLFALTLVVVALAPGLRAAAGGQAIANNTPAFVKSAKNLGVKSPSARVEISLWLQLHDQAGLEALHHQLYDPASPNFRHWLKSADIAARFAPTSQEVATVKQFLVQHNFKVTNVGPNNLFVHAVGKVDDAQKAFGVQINRFSVKGDAKGEERFANTSDPYIDGPAGALVSAVYGLDSGKFNHHYVKADSLSAFPHNNAKSSNAKSSRPVAQANQDGLFYASDCFTGTASQFFTTSGALPSATYTGNGFGAPITGGGLGDLPPCGYSPQDVRAAYNLYPLYNEGYDGTGQTIVIIDWCGSPYIQQDLNIFNTFYSLPPLTINILNVPTPSTCAAIDPEINIDVEWAHAIAPGAGIDLVVPPSNSFADIDEATTYAINYGLGNVISGSYGAPEYFVSQTILRQESFINLLAAVSGISANYSTGDVGDFADYTGYYTVNSPSDSPYATAVGGVSLALNADKSIMFQTGWGTNVTGLVAPDFLGNYVADPPYNRGFSGGSGGGPSAIFGKPFFQKNVPGKERQQPDISWLADPLTGGVDCHV